MSPSPRPAVVEPRFELKVDRVAKGGAALGLGPDGRVVFVDGAIPGETALVEVRAEHKSRIEADLVEAVDASPHRVDPPCPLVGSTPASGRCGGCDWQHIDPDHQAVLRRQVVADSLRRLGGIGEADIRPGPRLDPVGYRTTVRAGVVDGRAAYHQRRSNDLVPITSCLIAHPLVEEILTDGRFGSATEVMVRVGAGTGERLVVVNGPVDEVEVPDGVVVATGSVSAHDHGLGDPAGHSHEGLSHEELHRVQPHIHETIAGLRLQVSAGSFFQCRPDGAEVLAQLAGDAVADAPGVLLDAYCGVGLFGAVAGLGRQVIGVESNPVAAHDASHNYGPHSRVVTSRFEQWDPEPVGVAIADPARAGLKAAGCDTLAATGAELIALISCDPASLARDAALLGERGYQLDYVTVVDLFGHTSHVETVTRFSRR